ncbi:MAG TPA: hypothetical protein VNB22_24595, partial [Pyrinomonadaceae bacterium]|nr:hypothetical protein [Pyrinomonadaceae bacterium]
MRTILLGFAIAFLSLTVYSQRKQTDLEFEGLKGKVKSVQSSSMYLGTKDKPVKLPKRDYFDIEFYGLDGIITETLDPERGIKYVFQFVDGFLSMKEVVVDEKKAANIMRTGGFGNSGNMEKPVKTIKPDARFLSRFDDEYDDNGRRKLRRRFTSDGRMDSITLFIYNSAGLLEKEVYNSYGNKWTHSYTYDTNGNRKENIMKRSDAEDVVDMTDRTEYSGYKFD